MRILCLLPLVFLHCEARDRDKNLKTPYAKAISDNSATDEVTVSFPDAITAQNALCRELYCLEKEVCVVRKDNTAVCVKEKSWRKTASKKKSNKPRKKKIIAESSRSDCPACPVVHPVFVCGSDNVTYSSECRLQFKNCEDKTNIVVACQGRCPCRTDELDSGLVTAEASTSKPLKKHEMKAQGLLGTTSESSAENHISVSSRKKAALSETNQGCSRKELKELQWRLTDWFKTVFRQKVEEGSPADFVQNPVCISGYNHPLLSWAFLFFDQNRDNNLSMTELFELEADKYEQCINPFLEHCDANNDLEISGNEWCRCFQNKMSKRYK